MMKSRHPALFWTPFQNRIFALLLVLGCLAAFAVPQAIHAAASPASQCVACHTDPAKLKALTPPDPPAAEEGEG